MKLVDYLERYQNQTRFSTDLNLLQLQNKIDCDNWTICKLIGCGAFAKVFLVRHNKTDKDTGEQTREYYAMKRIKKSNI
jgi:serine/threonine protein kinase